MHSRSLSFSDICAGYGATVILERISCNLPVGKTTSILGRNGAGKTTLLETIMGHTRMRSGSITYDGEDISSLAPYARAKRRIAHVPQEREIFPSLTVFENLTIGARSGRWDLDRVYALFPNLKERLDNLGAELSGGEQQMLAIGRALVSNPTLLLLDEPTEGLAPIIRDLVNEAIEVLQRDSGLTVLLVDQDVELALERSDYVVVLNRGTITYEGPSEKMRRDSSLIATCMGLSAAAAKKPRLSQVG